MNVAGQVVNASIPYPYSALEDYEGRFHLTEKHDEMLQLLLKFDAFCMENGIHYSLADGTLLGAMRHGDFIPWDDDADVMITRVEYNKLRKALRPQSKIRLLKIHFLDRITARGFEDKKVYIDLFINEDMPKSKLLFGWYKFKTRLLRTYFNNTIVRNVRHDHFSSMKSKVWHVSEAMLRALTRVIIGKRDVFELNDATVSLKNHHSSGIYTRYTSRMYETRRRFDKSSYDAGYAVVNFRGHQLMTLQNSDTFLREMYGDYMRLLPEEKRKPEHPVNMMDSPKSCMKWYN